MWTAIITAAGTVLAAVLGLFGRKAETDGLARVQAGIDAAKKVDHSDEAQASDPNNRDRAA